MDLSSEDLIVDKVYGGSRNGNASDDPLPSLLGVDSGAGFRHLGRRPEVKTLKLLALKSNLSDPDWPDSIDTETGLFTYYGDNKKISKLHDTPRKGNLILKNIFNATHDKSVTDHFPVILLFSNAGVYRDVRFLGLAVPGSDRLSQNDDLVAIWRSSGPDNKRFQNYRSVFTILDVPVVTRDWLNDIKNGNAAKSPHAPKEWLNWLKYRKYTPLYAPNSINIRNKSRQLPQKKSDMDLLFSIYSRYIDTPTAFERCAVEISRLMMPSIGACELTPPSKDRGRDAVGLFKIGTGESSINVEFALEAKCYNPMGGAVDIKSTSRLISKLRNRQFGIFVTTSYISIQGYQEIKEDGHPVVIISGIDIVRILKEKIGDKASIHAWLDNLDL